MFLLLVGMFIGSSARGQNLTHLWTGLQEPQPTETLPVGKAPFQKPERKAKRNVPTEFVPVRRGEWLIASGWELGTNTGVIENKHSIFDPAFDTGDWFNATVPGTVLTTLVEQGVYPDPYFGLNNMAIPDTLCRMDWWYRNVFDCPPQSDAKRISLIFDGINYRSEIFLNGKKLGNIEGAFIRGEFDVTSLIKTKGKNVLAVHVFPPNNPGIPHEQSVAAGQGLNGGALSIDGPTFIASMGWDWIPGIRDRNTGIWQNVRLKSGDAVKILDPRVITALNLPDTTRAEITLNVGLKNVSGSAVEGKLFAGSDDFNLEIPYSLAPFESKTLSLTPEKYPELTIRNPRLWWPNGYGNPELYTLELRASAGDAPSDATSLRFGIREMSYELMVADKDRGNTRIEYTPQRTIKNGRPVFDYENRVAFSKDVQLPTLAEGAKLSDFGVLNGETDKLGAFLVIRVNGVRIFCRGGNWGMDDAMKRSSRKRLEPYMKLHRDLNFNIVRNWTGESTEEVFYELCDEYGLMVWNDFWITTDDTVEPNDRPLFLRNATDVVRRFRNHPSIVVWCPRNEGFAPKNLSQRLTEMLAREDNTRHYHGQSCKLNMPTSGPWEYFDDASLYYTRRAVGFNSEMGSFAVPTAPTIRKFIAPEDLWPVNDVWAYHDLHHTSQNFKGFMSAVNRYGAAENVDDFARKAQYVTYDAWRNMLEAWNSRMWNTTSGLILWMSHPAWPSMIWQTYTYDYETPGSYFGARKACEPLHIQMNLPGNDIVVVNTTRDRRTRLRASVACFDVEGRVLEKQSRTTESVAANSVTAVELAFAAGNKPDLYLVRLELKDAGGKTVSINDYWQASGEAAYRQLDALQNQTLTVEYRLKGERLEAEIQNRSKQIVPAIKLNAVDKTTGEIILPAYFSDGYFNLLPGEKRTVTLSLDDANLLKNCYVALNYSGQNTVKFPDARKNKYQVF